MTERYERVTGEMPDVDADTERAHAITFAAMPNNPWESLTRSESKGNAGGKQTGQRYTRAAYLLVLHRYAASE
jgi:hypothetical protein